MYSKEHLRQVIYDQDIIHDEESEDETLKIINICNDFSNSYRNFLRKKKEKSFRGGFNYMNTIIDNNNIK
jgi:hypothetical protein